MKQPVAVTMFIIDLGVDFFVTIQAFLFIIDVQRLGVLAGILEKRAQSSQINFQII